MASKRQIAEQVVRALAGGTPTKDFPISITEVMYAVEQERDTLIRNYLNNKFARGYYDIEGHFLSEHIVRIHARKYNDDTVLFYAPLERLNGKQVTPIALPDNRGIHYVNLHSSGLRISPTLNRNNTQGNRQFIPTNAHSLTGLHYGKWSARLAGRCGYWPSDNRLYLTCGLGFTDTDIANFNWPTDVNTTLNNDPNIPNSQLQPNIYLRAVSINNNPIMVGFVNGGSLNFSYEWAVIPDGGPNAGQNMQPLGPTPPNFLDINGSPYANPSLPLGPLFGEFTLEETTDPITGDVITTANQPLVGLNTYGAGVYSLIVTDNVTGVVQTVQTYYDGTGVSGFEQQDVNNNDYTYSTEAYDMTTYTQVNPDTQEVSEIGRMIIKLVGATRDIEDDVNLPMSADMESDIIKSLIQLYSVMIQAETDVTNDNIK